MAYNEDDGNEVFWEEEYAQLSVERHLISRRHTSMSIEAEDFDYSVLGVFTEGEYRELNRASMTLKIKKGVAMWRLLHIHTMRDESTYNYTDLQLQLQNPGLHGKYDSFSAEH